MHGIDGLKTSFALLSITVRSAPVCRVRELLPVATRKDCSLPIDQCPIHNVRQHVSSAGHAGMTGKVRNRFSRTTRTSPSVISPPAQSAEFRGNGGARRDRTDDLMLAKHALSQLSYGPGKTEIKSASIWMMVGLGRLERPTSPLSGVRSNHLSYRPVYRAARTPFKGRRQPAASSLFAKKEKRRRRCPANACSGCFHLWLADVSEEIR